MEDHFAHLIPRRKSTRQRDETVVFSAVIIIALGIIGSMYASQLKSGYWNRSKSFSPLPNPTLEWFRGEGGN